MVNQSLKIILLTVRKSVPFAVFITTPTVGNIRGPMTTGTVWSVVVVKKRRLPPIVITARESVQSADIHPMNTFGSIRQEKTTTTTTDCTVHNVLQPKPSETTPVETRPAETKPNETAPVETGPVETKPSETAPAETGAAENKPNETAPVETGPAEIEPEETMPQKAAKEGLQRSSSVWIWVATILVAGGLGTVVFFVKKKSS